MRNQTDEIHPSAEDNYNKKVAALLGVIAKMQQDDNGHARFQSDVHVALSIMENDIIGEIQEGLVDYKGTTVGRYFFHHGDRYGVINEGYEQLSRIAETIQKLNAFSEKVSQKYIEEKIFTWLKNEFICPTKIGDFIPYLLNEVSQAVENTTILVPIANTIVEASFEFCGVTIRSFSKAMVDEMATMFTSMADEISRLNAERFISDFRKKYQGYAVAEIKLVCEPDFASDLAINITARATDLLGIYSGAILMPNVKCTSRIRGCENIATYFTIIKRAGGGLISKNGILDIASAHSWCISQTELTEMKKYGLDIISQITTKKKISDFESTVLNMAFLYSKAAFTSDPMEKLVHMLSALESTLLRNENEPIQQNLAERVAFFITQELIERKEIIKNIKHVYGLRSRYLHHGHSSTDLNEISKFFLRVWMFYVNLVQNSGRFSSKGAFLDAIDDRKLS
jgi:hypothetical protein